MKLIEIDELRFVELKVVCIEKVLDRTVQKYVQALYGEKTPYQFNIPRTSIPDNNDSPI